MGTPCCLTPFGSTPLYYLGQQREHQKENTQEPLPLGYCHPVRVLATYAGDHVGYAAAETSFWSLSLRCSQESHMHIPVRGEEKAGRLALGACQAPWPPAHITPLFHVQAVQDSEQPSRGNNIYFAETSVARKAECWPEWGEGVTGSLWGGQGSALHS